MSRRFFIDVLLRNVLPPIGENPGCSRREFYQSVIRFFRACRPSKKAKADKDGGNTLVAFKI